MSRKKSFGPDIQKSYTYRELPIGATSIGIHSEVIKTGSWRTFRPVFVEKTPPCNEACPAGVDVRGFITLMKEGLFDQACATYLAENPFPGICGRVCFHPCEEVCNRKEFDQSIAINALERFVADFDSPMAIDRAVRKARVAVVGSGPAGLSSAYFLKRLGHEVTVFEALKEVGGLLRSAIPNYRLPITVVEKEVERLNSLGVQFITNYRVDEKNWHELEAFEAILLAFGANRPLPLPLAHSGGETEKILTGLKFLQAAKSGRKIPLGRKVAVIGGGNTAIDTARTALRLGASPLVIYRRSKVEMPAYQTEVEDALKEGVEIVFLASPVAIKEEGSALRIRCVRNRLEKGDEDRRARPIPIEGSEFHVEVHTIISAVGEMPDLSFIPENIDIFRESVSVDELGWTGKAGIFACGDLTDQPRSVAHAIGSGKRAAIAADRYFQGRCIEKTLETLRVGGTGHRSFKRYLTGQAIAEFPKTVHFEDLNPSYFQYKERVDKPRAPTEARTGFEEIFGNLSEKQALGEANRCFSCGMCYHCGNCYVFCPDGSVLKKETDAFNVINYEYCKGCGICENECPVGVIEMEREA